MSITVGYDANDDPLEMQVTTGIHLPRTLKFVASHEEGYSTYRETTTDTLVYLQHGTGNVLISFDDLLENLHDLRYTHSALLRDEFLAMLRTLTYEPDDIEDISWCSDCGDPEHTDDLYCTNDNHGDVCESCLEDYSGCSHCEERFKSTNYIGGESVCAYCTDNYYSYCDDCEAYWADDDDEHHHDEKGCDSECESPAQSFTVRNDGLEPLANDTRTTITLPAGVISEQGMDAIGFYLYEYANENIERLRDDNGYVDYDNCPRHKFSRFIGRFKEIGDIWQTKEGNFTKRLSRFAYKEFGLKLPNEVISKVGCIASDHSKGAGFTVGFTRDLNMPAEAFAHEDSCWWQSYYEGRCGLKSNGGFALRTFDDGNAYPVSGRAWIIPLKLVGGELTFEPADNTRRLEPTFETLTPDAYIVFNGYGDLSGYAPARIMSHMVGMTYRKVSFDCYLADYSQNDMYVNSSAGYLVAPEEIAEGYTDGRLALTIDKHSDLYHDEQAAQHITFQSKETVNV